MTAQTRTTLKGYFNTSDVPTETNFADLIDTFATLAEYASVSNGLGASLIGIEDAAGNYTGTTVEAALAEAATPEGTAIKSTGEAGGTKFLREDGDGTSSWQTISGGGDALVANPLSQFAATTSAQLAGVLSDETGTGAAVFANSPTLVTPALGTPASGVATNLTGTASGLTAGTVEDNAITLAKMAGGTDGNLISYDTAGDPVAVATGTAGQVLTSNGAGAAPSMQDLGGSAVTEDTFVLADKMAWFDTSASDALKYDTGTDIRALFMASPTLTGTPVLPATVTIASNSFVRSGAHDLTLTTGATTNVTLPASGTLAILGANTFTGTQDFNGQQVEGMLNKVVATVTGTLTTTAHSGNVLETSGNVTVPTTAGFNCVLIAGGAHTVTFDGNTSAAMAAGDLMTIIVEDATTVHAVLTAAADKVTFS